MPFRNEIAREGILVETSSLENACGGEPQWNIEQSPMGTKIFHIIIDYFIRLTRSKKKSLNCLIEKKEKKENVSTLSTLFGLIRRK